MISIWFFIGISLAVNGALILAAGIYQLINPPETPTVVLYNLHAGCGGERPYWCLVLFIVSSSLPGDSRTAKRIPWKLPRRGRSLEI